MSLPTILSLLHNTPHGPTVGTPMIRALRCRPNERALRLMLSDSRPNRTLLVASTLTRDPTRRDPTACTTRPNHRPVSSLRGDLQLTTRSRRPLLLNRIRPTSLRRLRLRSEEALSAWALVTIRQHRTRTCQSRQGREAHWPSVGAQSKGSLRTTRDSGPKEVHNGASLLEVRRLEGEMDAFS